jgi:fructose-bisphosphate aldolase class I
MDGSHSIERCEEVTSAALHAVFNALCDHGVCLEGMLLKPNMVVSGNEHAQQAGPEEVAEATLRCFRRHVPAAVPGVVFLSGGMSDVTATRNLNALNRLGGAPWELSFSFGRALQAPALQAWAGREENTVAGQEALLHRARCNHAARFGRYEASMEGASGS